MPSAPVAVVIQAVAAVRFIVVVRGLNADADEGVAWARGASGPGRRSPGSPSEWEVQPLK